MLTMYLVEQQLCPLMRAASLLALMGAVAVLLGGLLSRHLTGQWAIGLAAIAFDLGGGLVRFVCRCRGTRGADDPGRTAHAPRQ